MATYYFNIAGPHPFIDEVGSNLPSVDAVWEEALRIVKDIEGSLRPGESWALEVVRDGQPIYRVTILTEDLRGPRIDR